MSLIRTLLAGTALAVALAVTATPAVAEVATFKDDVADAPKRIDIRAVKVKHGPKNVKVVVRFTNLRKKDQHLHDLAVWFATRPGARPQYLVAASAYHLYFGQTKGWRLKQPVKHPFGNVACDSGYRYQSAKNRVVFKFPRHCLGNPKRIRVAVSSALVEYDEAGNPVGVGPDDLVAAKHLTSWVRSSAR